MAYCTKWTVLFYFFSAVAAVATVACCTTHSHYYFKGLIDGKVLAFNKYFILLIWFDFVYILTALRSAPQHHPKSVNNWNDEVASMICLTIFCCKFGLHSIFNKCDGKRATCINIELYNLFFYWLGMSPHCKIKWKSIEIFGIRIGTFYKLKTFQQ